MHEATELTGDCDIGSIKHGTEDVEASSSGTESPLIVDRCAASDVDNTSDRTKTIDD